MCTSALSSNWYMCAHPPVVSGSAPRLEVTTAHPAERASIAEMHEVSCQTLGYAKMCAPSSADRTCAPRIVGLGVRCP